MHIKSLTLSVLLISAAGAHAQESIRLTDQAGTELTVVNGTATITQPGRGPVTYTAARPSGAQGFALTPAPGTVHEPKLHLTPQGNGRYLCTGCGGKVVMLTQIKEAN